MIKIYFVVILSLFIFIPIELNSQSHSFDYLNQVLSEGEQQALLWADNPSTIAIYEKLESHVRSLEMNVRNTEDLIAYYNSREGYLNTIVTILQRIRQLVLQRSNSLYGPDEREMIDSEIHLLYSSILKELSMAQFNTIPLFATWIDSEALNNRFREDNFYTIKGVDRILKFLLAERAKMGALINTSSLTSSGDADSARMLSSFMGNEILFFSHLFLFEYEK